MPSTVVLMRRWPRMTAAVSFGAVGSFIPATWFLLAVLSRQDGVALVLFLVVPGATAALAGALAGAPLCDPARTISERNAVVRGMAVALFALIIFAPMFAAFFAYTSPGNLLGMVILVLTFSLLAIGGVQHWLEGQWGGCCIILHYLAVIPLQVLREPFVEYSPS